MDRMKRTVTCGELRGADESRHLVLNGWVHRHRDHGGIRFVDLRDRYGITQVVFDSEKHPEAGRIAQQLKYEYCIAVSGAVRKRPESMVNPDMKTGEIEIEADGVEILSRCATLPFMIERETSSKEETRLKYRYLDLRSFSMQERIDLRHRATYAVREYLNDRGFLEIETPILIRSTPEGARDFLVPSRLHRGRFYALPQSPQIFKQILMISEFDRYFQIARCFRDEDARGDRQLEHTQIDIEMSFVSKEDVFEVVEGMMQHVFSKTLGVELEVPFARLSYEEAMSTYGSDKPDLRFGLEMKSFEPFVPQSEFKVFKNVLESGGTVRALVAPGCADYSRKQIDELEGAATVYGAKGLAWMKVVEDGGRRLDGGVSRFFSDQNDAIIDGLNAGTGDLILIVADTWKTCCTALGAVRSKLGRELLRGEWEREDGARNADPTPESFKFCWIVDFPLFEWNDEEEKWDPAHHMFTMPQERYVGTLENDPGSVKGDLYDLVCNGLELASGSIRIHDQELQQRVFSLLGIGPEEAERRFGFLLKAFEYGPPPHGGIAPGLDRLIMLMTGQESIKEVIPFPKNTLGISPMDGSPSTVDPEQLKELHIELLPESDDETRGRAGGR